MKLVKETYNYLRDSELSKWLIMTNIINNIIFSVVLSDLLINITNDKLHLLPYYLMLKAVQPLIEKYIITKISTDLTNQICKKFVSDKYEIYTSTSYESKILKPYSTFKQAIGPAKFAIYMMIDWGLPNIINLISITFSVFWTFWMKNLVIYFIILCGIFSTFYILYLKPKQMEFTKKDKELRKMRQVMEAKLELNGIPYQYKEVETDEMINYEHNIANYNKDIEIYWNTIMNDSMIMLEYMNISILYFVCNDIKTLLLISLILRQFRSGCQSLMSFMTQYNRYSNDYETMNDIMKDVIINTEPEKKYLSRVNSIIIEHVDIPLGDNYRLAFDPCLKNLEIKQGTKMLIMGPSGFGKSSFIKGLFGLLEKANVKLNEGKGSNYYHTVVDYFQEIKEKMPSSKVSLRDYFRKEPNNDIIKKYLQYGWSTDEHNRILQSIHESNENKHDSSIFSNSHNYDLPINEKLSGGQKSRLIFWQRGYICDTLNKEIIILDEPMPDVDNESYVDNIQRFFKMYNDKTIIMVAHPCECKKKILYPLMNIKLSIKNGMIHQIND